MSAVSYIDPARTQRAFERDSLATGQALASLDAPLVCRDPQAQLSRASPPALRIQRPFQSLDQAALRAPPSPSASFLPLSAPIASRKKISFKHGGVSFTLSWRMPQVQRFFQDDKFTSQWLDELGQTTPKATDGLGDRSLWRHESALLGGCLAIKRLSKGSLKLEHQLKQLEQFRRSEALVGLYHPRLTEVYGVIESDEHIDVLMEWIDGCDLFDLHRSFKPLQEAMQGSPRRVLYEQLVAKLIKNVLKGVLQLHQRQMVHRDLKLENVMVCLKSTGRICLSDFEFLKAISGLSADEKEVLSDYVQQVRDRLQAPFDRSEPLLLSRQEAVHTPCGTGDYLAPEWLVHRELATRTYDFQSDLYAIGRMCCELLGYSPYYLDVETLPFLLKNLPQTYPSSWSKEAIDFVKQAMHPLLRERFKSVQQMLDHPFLQVDETDWLADLEKLNVSL